MAELKTKPTKASVTDFLQTIDESRRADCKALVRMMSEATGARPRMWGPSIIGFGDHEYKNAAGKASPWFIAGFSPRKRDLTLYLMTGIARYPSHLKKLGDHSTGKSCLYIKRLADVDVAVLKDLIATAVKDLRTPRHIE